MNRLERTHEEILTEEISRNIQTNRDTANIPNITEILNKNMETSVKIEIRRTVMTRRGRKFSPREPVSFDLVLPGQQTTWEGFETIQERVKMAFPRLQEEFSILCKDGDGDLVSCNNKEELLKALDQASEDTLLLYVQGPCNWKNQAKDVPLECAHCSTSFHGMTVKCLECADFNLCPHCDEKGIHGSHVMVRCDRPRFFNYALPLFAEAIPKLCKEIRQKTLGDTMPRLCPKDIRQFWQKERKLRDDKMECDENATAKRKVMDRPRPCTKKHVCEKRQQDVQCSNCTGVIQGMRVKCLECEDINLCQQCDDQGVHGNHVMVKCDRPRFFNFALPMFVEVIPKLCGEKKGEGHGDCLPRLEPKEVRQFWQKEKKENGRRVRIAQTQCSTESLEQTSDKVEMCPKSQPSVACTNCKIPIQTMRIKCLECDEFDLCEVCDGQGIHTDHVMVKCDKPRFFNYGLRHFAEVLPKLIEEHKEKHDTQVPRLERQEVRQFWVDNRVSGSDGQKNKCQEKRQHMRKMWHMFLQDISAQDESPGTDWEMVPDDGEIRDDLGHNSSEEEMITKKVENIDLVGNVDQSDTKPKLGDQIQHMRRQWMQKCLQQWRQQMHARRQYEQPNPKLAFKLWRPYMRGCWDSWVDLSRPEPEIADNEMTAAPSKERQNKFCHSRRRWIQSCWKLWCQQASENIKERGSDEADTQLNRGGPFPGFPALMRESWKIMPHHMRSQNIVNNDDCAHISESAAEGADDIDFDPKRAEQMLKSCWVNGCRELWWMQIRKLMDLPDVDNEDNGMPSQRDVMETMSIRQNWRSYMQQIWRLWNQLSKQAGFTEKGELTMAASGSVDEAPGSTAPRHPKQIWIESCWQQWNEEMKKNTTDGPDKARAEKPRWNRRPFAGWRPLIIRSWQIMKSVMEEKGDTVEKRSAQIRSMRAAWIKGVLKEVNTVSMQQDGQCIDEFRPGEVVDKNNVSHIGEDASENLQWLKHTKIQRKLMQQYWQMWKTHKESKDANRGYPAVNWRQRKADRKHQRACASSKGYCGDHNDELEEGTRPRLRLKLMMKNSKSTSE